MAGWNSVLQRFLRIPAPVTTSGEGTGMVDVAVCNELERPISYTEEVDIAFSGGLLSMRYRYSRDGPMCKGGYLFRHVRAFRHKADAYCTKDELETSYCRLVEILESGWVGELQDSNMYDEELWPMHHYRFFFPDEGCYEVVAESWEVLSDATTASAGT